MKGRLGKFGLLFLAVALCLAITGAGFAMWDKTLDIDGTVNTGEVNAGMFLATNSYGASYYGNPTSPLPEIGGTDDGIWDSAGQNDNDWDKGVQGPIVNDWKEDPWVCPQYVLWGCPDPEGTLLDKDVGSTAVTGTDSDGDGYWDTMTITVTNAYPYYVSGASFCIINTGTVPIHLVGIRAVGEVPTELTVAIEDYPPYYTNKPDWEYYGLNIIKTGYEWIVPYQYRYQLEPEQWALTGILVVVNQNAEQGATYSFTIELMTQQWNEE